MKKWSVLTLVGADQSGIVAAVTRALAAENCELGETSMMQMGSNFSMMMRVRHDDIDLATVLNPVCESLGLHLHIDDDVDGAQMLSEPDVNITVYGADRSGIVAEVTSVLAEAGLNIIDLETAVGGTEEKPIYIMMIEGTAANGIDALEAAAENIAEGIELNIVAIQTLRA